MAEEHALLAGRYRLVRQVGRGGMGVVWEARDERLLRPVAVKELRPQPGLSPEEAELAKNRAMREARITARLHHRNAVPVFDVVEHDGQPCLIMQFVPSVPLSAVLREGGPLGVDEAARMGAQVASALAAAHRLDIVHRDVKPGNILIDDDGTALLSDFGISHALGDATLTSTGLLHGTPAYLAPEVARGAQASFASDVFSLGATLYTALEGAPPFGTDSNSIALLYRVASGEFTPPQRAGVLAPVLTAMLSPDPDARPEMREVAARLAAVEAGESAPAPDPAPGPAPVGPAPTRLLPTAETRPASSEATSTTQVRPVEGPPTFAAPPVAAPRAAATAGPPPPSTPAIAPPPSARPAGGRRRGAWVAGIAAVVALVVLATALVVGQVRRGGDGTAAGPAPVGTPTATAPTTASESSSESESPEPTTSDTPSEAPSPSPTPTAPTASPTPTPSSGAPTAAELEAAITEYYALVPDDTDAAWLRLTADYQRKPSGGRQAYQRFWDQVDRVSVSKVAADPPSQVEATVTYRRGDAESVERTSFRLVRDDGVLKIDSSKVVSSS